jgi:protein-disulfide isomerase
MNNAGMLPRPIRRIGMVLALLLSMPLTAGHAADASAASAAPAAGVAAAPGRFSSADKTEIEQIVRQYLLANPEILLELMRELDTRDAAAKQKATQSVLRERQKDLFADPDAPVLGNPNGDVVMVEFFDYNCGYCKQAHPQRNAALKKDGKVRLLLKEFPILGPTSMTAAKVALAARFQNRYQEMHEALMAHRGPLSEEDIFSIAGTVGLDVDTLKTQMESAEVTRQIAANIQLARSLDVSGTPAFIVGETLIPGAMDSDAFTALFAAERERQKSAQAAGRKG